MFLWLQKAGRHFQNPTTLVPRSGPDLNILEVPPTTIGQMFSDDLKDQQAQQDIGKELGTLPPPPPLPPGLEGGVDWVQIRRGLRHARKKLTPEEYTSLRHYMCGSLITGEVLSGWKYDLQPSCQYCMLLDTQFHRLWE